ncbi:MAG: hypothetical protein M0P50_15320, partial [Bacteroidales bacterium]|nr:hypothetical protein [Bacteroidales bacterium]
MKTFTKFTTLLLVLFFTNSLISQTLESPWALYPRECNLNTSPPEIFLLPEADENYNEPYNDANAAYTPNGNLVFFMLNEGLYDAAGEFIGPLSFIGDMILPETNILPVPGSSNHFYLIYAAATLPAGNSVSYAIVNCENNEYEITSNGIPIAEQPGGNLVGLAVSPLMPDNSHRLYISDNEGIKRYKIGDIESGIEFVENILTTPGGYQTRQLELSTDCKKLAWGGAWGMRYDGSKLSIIELNQNGSYASNYSIPITDGVYEPNSSAVISGVEFSYDNTKVYVSIQGGTTSSPTGGLFCYNFNTSDVTSLVYNDYSITHLQKDTKGNIYAVANDGSNLGKITTANNNFNPSFQSINIFSNGLEYTLGDYYSLPDLIDHFDLEATISIVPESCANTYDGEATVIVNGGVSP